MTTGPTTVQPTPGPATQPTPTPAACVDSATWHGQASDLHTCAFVGGDIAVRCSWTDSSGVTALDACPATCNPNGCNTPATNPPTTVQPTPSADCVDSTSWHGQASELHTCSFVAGDTTVRCSWVNSDGVTALEACPSTCNGCSTTTPATSSPSLSSSPSSRPSTSPSHNPSSGPSHSPSRDPSTSPSLTPSASPTAEPAPSVCFSGSMTVELQNHTRISMNRLQVGDVVRVDENGYERVYAFGHFNETALGDYLELTFANNPLSSSSSSLEISANHLLFRSDGVAVPASQFAIGDEIVGTNSSSTRITSIREIQRPGAFAPFTASGTLLVNGVKASNYISLQGSIHLMIGGASTPFSHQWIAHSILAPVRWSSAHNRDVVAVASLHNAASVFLKLNPVVQSLAAIPLLCTAGILSLVDSTVVYYSS